MGKPCQSPNCVYPIFSNGFCKFHQSKRQDLKYKSRKSISQTHVDKMKALQKENGSVGVVEVREETELQKWFSEKMANSPKVCENCGKSLANYNQKDWFGSHHHVLEKSLYESVKTNPLNHLVLGKWCCHHVWHSSWEKASQMRIFPKAIEIIEKLYPLLTREEKRKLPEVVTQELKPVNS